jgi:hypothetical protein
LIPLSPEPSVFQSAVENVMTSIYETIISLLILFLCETWSLKLCEEDKRRVLENRVLTRIFGPRRDDVSGWWRELHNEELHDLYSWPSIISIIKSRMM